MLVKIEESWKPILEAEFASPYFSELASFVRAAYRKGPVYPPAALIFAAFNKTPFEKVRVVILGQDPYHNPGQAHGLSFSVPPGIPVPPSLANIYKELESEFSRPFSNRGGDLSAWANQGVLLLNATLTVAAGAPGSHQHRGWEKFTDAAIKALSEKREHIVFLLWGSYARSKRALIDDSRHLVLETAHPSPLSAYRGFFGCNHFRAANDYLEKNGLKPIDW